MVKIRLHGLEEEVTETVEELKKSYDLLSVSKPYLDRGESRYVRVYIDAKRKGERNVSS